MATDELEALRRRVADLEAELESRTESHTAVALQAREDQFRTLIETMQTGVMLQDPDAEMLLANPAALRLLGLTEDQLMGRSSFDPRWNVVRPDGDPFPGPEHPVPQAIATRQAVRNVVMGVFRPEVGDRIWLLVDAIPQLGPDGRVIQVLCTFQDHSRQKAEEDALRASRAQVRAQLEESEERYGSLVSALAEGVVLQNRDGSIEMANAAAEEILGLTQDQLLGRTSMDPRWHAMGADGAPLPGKDHPPMITLRTGSPLRGAEMGIHKADGSRSWLSVNTQPLFRGDDPEPVGVVSSFHDVTHSRSMMVQLRESRAFLQRMTDAIPGALFEYMRRRDGADRLIYMSGGGPELFGLPRSELLKRDFGFDLVPPWHKPIFEASLDTATRKLEVWSHDFPIEPPGHALRWVRVTATPEGRPDGVAFNGIVMDITRERQVEEALRKSRKTEAIGDLAAGVAHNFNNMLSGILPNLEYCRRLASEDLVAPLDDAIGATRSAADVVRQLMTLTRSDDATSLEALRVVTPLTDAVRVCERTFDRAIHLELTVDAPEAVVVGHRTALQQLFLNLLINARDALDGRDERVIRVRASVAPERDDGLPTVMVEVADTGMGMAPSTLARLGEPFFTTKAPGRGTGLGLASAYGVVRDHRGWIECESEPGEGTTFRVHLPLTQTPAPESVPPASLSISPSRRATVLLVDDELVVRRSYARALSQAGYQVDLASNGQEALDRFDPTRHDIVLLDLSMPVMPGTEVLKRLRSARPDHPIIILTGDADPGEAIASANAILRKPVDRDALLEALRNVVTLAPNTV